MAPISASLAGRSSCMPSTTPPSIAGRLSACCALSGSNRLTPISPATTPFFKRKRLARSWVEGSIHLLRPSLGAVNSVEEFGDRLEVRDDGISHMRKYGYTLFGGFRVACAAGVADENGDDAEIGGVTACGFDTDLEGDAGEDETADGAVAQGEVGGRGVGGRHGELGGDGVGWARAEVGNEFKCPGVVE